MTETVEDAKVDEVAQAEPQVNEPNSNATLNDVVAKLDEAINEFKTMNKTMKALQDKVVKSQYI